MTTIKCSGEGCSTVFETSEAVSTDVKYSCRFHTRKTGAKERFQNAQFDHEMRRAAHPVGTGHIKNQGSDLDNGGAMQEQMRDNAALYHGK